MHLREILLIPSFLSLFYLIKKNKKNENNQDKYPT